jgi:hypothetical protein
MFTILQCQICKSGYEYCGPQLKSNPLIDCEYCGRITRANVFVLLHKDDAVFKPLDEEIKPHEDPRDMEVARKTQADSLGIRPYMGRPYRPIPLISEKQEQAFWRYVKKAGPDDCWPWKGSRDAFGYGLVCFAGKRYHVSRVLWRLVTGTDPGQRQVCHECDNPPCCNPNHLFLGDHGDNAADKAIKGRARNGFTKMQ